MQIIINGTLTQLGGALPNEITSCEINADPAGQRTQMIRQSRIAARRDKNGLVLP